ncbi:hypothetical protein AB1Y20_013706 [Prymnesium parvum]|uniref:MOSC domain-containing protein n=1 Tax=Prymnesium parvum TaxID=97485 RepID=A0AB34IJV1_PRYPA
MGKRCRDTTRWVLVRAAAKDKRTRVRQGGRKSPQTKLECAALDLKTHGVVGDVPSLLGSFLGGWFCRRIEDHNDYRTTGHTGRFEACTPDRAVSLVTEATYSMLRAKLPGIKISDGDLGENLLVSGPALEEGVDLRVGSRLKLGTAEIELTEANKPCYRLGFLPWARDAQKLYGETWWTHPELPLDHETHPGGRGWLAKVVVEGRTKKGDEVINVSHSSSSKKRARAKKSR